MIVSGYSLHVYCDGEPCALAWKAQWAEFTSESKQRCWKDARAAGWLLSTKERKAYCKGCRKAPRPVTCANCGETPCPRVGPGGTCAI